MCLCDSRKWPNRRVTGTERTGVLHHFVVDRRPCSGCSSISPRRLINSDCIVGQAVPLAVESRRVNERIGRKVRRRPRFIRRSSLCVCQFQCLFGMISAVRHHAVSDSCNAASQSAFANFVPVRPMTSSSLERSTRRPARAASRAIHSSANFESPLCASG